MTDISYKNWLAMSDQDLCKRIGEYVRHIRLNRNCSQEEIATQASISRSTLSQLERGKTVTLLTLIQVLRVLDALHIMEVFQTITSPSPLALARLEQAQRQRASVNKEISDL